MNIKNILIIAISLTLLIILSGCEAASEPEVQQQPQTETKQPTVEKETTETTTPETAEYSAADMAAYQGALQLEDASFCEKITDAELVQACKNDVKDTVTYKEATNNADASMCEELSSVDLQSACKIDVEVATEREKQREEEETEKQNENELQNEIIGSGDYTKCSQLSDPNFAMNCELTILLNKAIQEEDISNCEKASSEQIKSDCIKDYKLLVPEE